MSARQRASRAEYKVSELGAELSRQDRKIMGVSKWISDMEKEHHPYIGGRIDLSICDNSNLRAGFLESAGKQLYCRTCRNPWPCKTLQNVRVLSDVLRGREYEGLPCKAEKQSGIELYL